MEKTLLSWSKRKLTLPGKITVIKSLAFSKFIHLFTALPKKGKRKVQGVPQLQTAALPKPQEEEETDKSKQAQNEQTYEKH